MTDFDKKSHWENVYATKELHEVSWYQPVPQTSLDFLEEAQLPRDAKIIDVGGGDSFLVDHLLDLGFMDITVTDISGKALDRVKKRLGEKAEQVKWITADASGMKLNEQYDFWHDRAAFHFMTQAQDIRNYLSVASAHIKQTGVLVIGTFSENGPAKCSGIEVTRYSEKSLEETVNGSFEKIRCLTLDHQTPFGTSQNFVFCSFRKK